MPDILIDGNFQKPTPVGDRRFEYPFRANGDRVSAVFLEDYWQTKATFSPERFPIQHHDLRDFYLIAESPPEPVIADLYKFTRTFARVPSQQTEYSSILITIPEPVGVGAAEGLLTDVGVATADAKEKVYVTANWAYARGSYYSPIKVSSSNRVNGVVTVTNHGMNQNKTLLELFAYYTSGSNATTAGIWRGIIYDSTQWANTNANALTVQNANGTLVGFLGYCQIGGAGANAITAVGAGARFIRCKRVTDYYLPGVSSGITTPDDIPLPADESGSLAFLNAILGGTGTVNIQVGELRRWRESPIYEITKTTINVADLAV